MTTQEERREELRRDMQQWFDELQRQKASQPVQRQEITTETQVFHFTEKVPEPPPDEVIQA